MKAMVVYESMFGNTRAVAEAIGAGLQPTYQVTVCPARTLSPADLDDIDLVVAGGPTHVHGLSRPSTREGAGKQAAVPGSGLHLETGATGPGLRELFRGVTGLRSDAAAFDTRVAAAPILTGRASKAIGRMLRRCGCTLMAGPESFLVSKERTQLLAGEEARARDWGSRLAALRAPAARQRP